MDFGDDHINNNIEKESIKNISDHVCEHNNKKKYPYPWSKVYNSPTLQVKAINSIPFISNYDEITLSTDQIKASHGETKAVIREENENTIFEEKFPKVSHITEAKCKSTNNPDHVTVSKVSKRKNKFARLQKVMKNMPKMLCPCCTGGD